jgi:hypothetical protein
MTDDTPRDPLAALLAEFEVADVDDDPTILFAGNADELAALLRVTLDATRPNGDETLRAAAQAVVDHYVEVGGDYIDALRAALATPSSAPDVEGLTGVDHWDTVRLEVDGIRVRDYDDELWVSLRDLRDSRS